MIMGSSPRVTGAILFRARPRDNPRATKSIPAPDAEPGQAEVRAPPGACDAPCHVFGPYAPERRYTPPDAAKEKLAALHRHLGLERAVLVQASCHGKDNRAMLEAIATSGGKWRGVALVGADLADRELAALHAGGVRGVRFNFVQHLGSAPDIDAVDGVLARVAPLGWHVVLHLDAEDIGTYRGLLDALRLPFVIDHMGRVKAAHGVGQQPFRLLLDLMANPLAWMKVSGAERVCSAGPPFHDAVPFAAALIEAALDRVLWGTDFPHPESPRGRSGATVLAPTESPSVGTGASLRPAWRVNGGA
jgi:predicted TIM-barrel fold metal-dependent hydrolase